MSVTPAQDGDGFHLVVAEDGSLPAAELARFGLRPGTHLRVVPEQVTAKRKSARGLLAGTVAAGGVESLVQAMAEAKAERIAHLTADVPEA